MEDGSKRTAGAHGVGPAHQDAPGPAWESGADQSALAYTGLSFYEESVASPGGHTGDATTEVLQFGVPSDERGRRGGYPCVGGKPISGQHDMTLVVGRT